jgi:hypothetical protein
MAVTHYDLELWRNRFDYNLEDAVLTYREKRLPIHIETNLGDPSTRLFHEKVRSPKYWAGWVIALMPLAARGFAAGAFTGPESGIVRILAVALFCWGVYLMIRFGRRVESWTVLTGEGMKVRIYRDERKLEEWRAFCGRVRALVGRSAEAGGQ